MRLFTPRWKQRSRLLVSRRVVGEDPWLAHQARRMLFEERACEPLRQRVAAVARCLLPLDLHALALADL